MARDLVRIGDGERKRLRERERKSEREEIYPKLYTLNQHPYTSKPNPSNPHQAERKMSRS